MRRLLIVGAIAAVLASCTQDTSRPVESAPEPSRTAGSSRADRPPTRPHRKVVLETTGEARTRIATAIDDLKTIGFWERLTGSLFEVQLDARSGRSNIPRDEHLADAYYTAKTEPNGGGTVCDIMFFSTSIAADLERWRSLYAEGRIDRPPPESLRQYYGSLLAHELGHCQPGPRGEPEALSWEHRAVTALQEAGLR